MEIKHNFYLSNEAQETTWHAYLIQPYKEGYKNLKRSFGQTDQLRAKHLTSQELQSRLIGLKNLAHRIKFIGIGFALIFPLANVISQIALKRIFNENVKSNSTNDKTKVTPINSSDVPGSKMVSLNSDPNPLNNKPSSLPTPQVDNKPPSFDLLQARLVEEEKETLLDLLQGRLEEEKKEVPLDLLQACLVEEGNTSDTMSSAFTAPLLNSLSTSKQEEKKLQLPLHIKIFNQALDIHKGDHRPLLKIIEDLIDALDIDEKDDLKIQVLIYLVEPVRLFKEIKKDLDEKKEGDLPDSLMDLLKNKLYSYNLYSCDNLILNHKVFKLYGEKGQVSYLSFAENKNTSTAFCKIEIADVEKAVFDRILDSLLEKSSIFPSITVGEQMSKEIERLLKGVDQPEKLKTEIWTDFAKTYVTRFVWPFLIQSTRKDAFDVNRIGLMTQLEDELGAKALSNFNEIQELMLKAYLDTQKSVLAKRDQDNLTSTRVRTVESKNWGENLFQKPGGLVIKEKTQVDLDGIKENIQKILNIDFPESPMTQEELDRIIN